MGVGGKEGKGEMGRSEFGFDYDVMMNEEWRKGNDFVVGSFGFGVRGSLGEGDVQGSGRKGKDQEVASTPVWSRAVSSLLRKTARREVSKETGPTHERSPPSAPTRARPAPRAGPRS